MKKTIEYDPKVVEKLEDPYPYFNQLRKQDPIQLSHYGWVLSRFDDCSAVLSGKKFGVTGLGATIELQQSNSRAAKFIANRFHSFDSPKHTRLRGSVTEHFRKTMVQSFTNDITDRAHHLARSLSGELPVEIMEEFAFPLATGTLSSIMGFSEKDFNKIAGWSAKILKLQGALSPDPTVIKEAESAITNFESFLEPYLNEYYQSAAVGSFSKALADAQREGIITHDEAVNNIIFLVNAGFSTTAKMIGNALHAILNKRDIWELLVQDKSNAQEITEEALRYDCSLTRTVRFALEDTFIGNKKIHKGEQVLCLLNAANRDPERFSEPDKFVLGRKGKRHVSFGGGPHLCLGIHLARLQISLALEVLSQSFPLMRLSGKRVTWSSGNYRGPSKLSVLVN